MRCPLSQLAWGWRWGDTVWAITNCLFFHPYLQNLSCDLFSQLCWEEKIKPRKEKIKPSLSPGPSGLPSPFLLPSSVHKLRLSTQWEFTKMLFPFSWWCEGGMWFFHQVDLYWKQPDAFECLQSSSILFQTGDFWDGIQQSISLACLNLAAPGSVSHAWHAQQIPAPIPLLHAIQAVPEHSVRS